MRKAGRLELNEAQRMELERGYRLGEKHCFRMRCLAILLKAEGLSAAKVGERTEMEQHTVSKWLKRYKKEGIKGLEMRPGRGRKPIMDSSDEEAVRRAIEQDRQSVDKAREAWQQASGKEASESTFKRFLSALAQDISV
ncbi:MAG: helix-turn-helix domain-containing protein [Bacteroidales bacterium]|nr:helix-turn-helix domain-containing protein [Bacteroidales bacterium]MBQ6100831.1 helix-turn-helix domain-containing protein [Bacteroidales bacterium]